MTTLYDIIREACYKKDISVSQMCDECGISRATMSRVRNGSTKSITPKVARKIAAYLDLDMSELIGANRPVVRRKDADALGADDLYDLMDDLRNKPELRMLFKASKNATPSQLKAVAETLEVMTRYNKDDSNSE